MLIRAVGNATFVVTLASGAVVVIDPWFSRHPLAPRALPLPFGVESLPRCRAVLVSHNHIDHVDGLSLRAARRMRSTLIGPLDVILRGCLAGVRDCRYVRPGDRVALDDGATVEATHADHPLCCGPVGFLLTDADGTTLYHSGDTRYDERIFGDVDGRRIDVACLQIGASGYPLIGRDGMNVPEAARLTQELDARIAIPMHFHIKGKVADPRDFTRLLGKRACTLEPGESLEVRAAEPA